MAPASRGRVIGWCGYVLDICVRTRRYQWVVSSLVPAVVQPLACRHLGTRVSRTLESVVSVENCDVLDNIGEGRLTVTSLTHKVLTSYLYLQLVYATTFNRGEMNRNHLWSRESLR